MSDSSVAGDLALGAAFAPAERAAWQALVARACKLPEPAPARGATE